MSPFIETERMESSDYIWKALRYVFLISLLSAIVGPFIIIISTSLKTSGEVFDVLSILPSNPTSQPWRTGFDVLSPNLLNSLIIASGTAIVSLIITIPGAYVFGRKDFPGKQIGFYTIISTLLFPYVILVIPIGSTLLELGFYNTIPGLWIANQIFVTPFAIWMLRDFFEGLPANIEEAAQVYGCSQFMAFVRTILPLSIPAIIAVGFLSFLSGWNDFLFANILTSSQGPQPVTVTLYTSVVGGSGERIYWNLVAAEGMIVGLPPLILYLFSRRYITNAFAY